MESENHMLALRLSLVGYPGYSYLQHCEGKEMPMKVLLAVLLSRNPEPRLIEALPWVILRYWYMDFNPLIEGAKSFSKQNQLGFLVSIARRISQTSHNRVRTETLKQIEVELDAIRIDGEFFLFPIRTTVQRDWIASNREPEAKHWGVLATLKLGDIDYESWVDEAFIARD